MTRRRRNNKFRNKQNRALHAKRLKNIEKRESQRQTFNKRKESNLDHIRELNRQAFAKSKKSNPQHVQEVNKNAQNSTIFQPNFIVFLILLNPLVSVNVLVIKIITSNLADVWQIIFSLNLLTFYHLKRLVLAIKVWSK